jgi:hypothetical protein
MGICFLTGCNTLKFLLFWSQSPLYAEGAGNVRRIWPCLGAARPNPGSISLSPLLKVIKSEIFLVYWYQMSHEWFDVWHLQIKETPLLRTVATK